MASPYSAPYADSAPGDSTGSPPGPLANAWAAISRRQQRFLDIWTPHTVPRWISTFVVILAYMLRIILAQGWYLITYGLGIYILNLFLAFLTPKVDPVTHQSEEDDEGSALPTSNAEEFRPFIRRLPEFKFWYSMTKAVVICLFLSLFEFTNIPVFWPILVVYFIVLTCLTLKRQIKHMIKHKYLPFSHGKTIYQGKEGGR